MARINSQPSTLNFLLSTIRRSPSSPRASPLPERSRPEAWTSPGSSPSARRETPSARSRASAISSSSTADASSWTPSKTSSDPRSSASHSDEDRQSRKPDYLNLYLFILLSMNTKIKSPAMNTAGRKMTQRAMFFNPMSVHIFIAMSTSMKIRALFTIFEISPGNFSLIIKRQSIGKTTHHMKKSMFTFLRVPRVLSSRVSSNC